MIRLARVIETFEADFLAQYRDRVSAEHLRALAALRQCRTHASPKIELQCPQCEHRTPSSPFLRPPSLPALSAPRRA